MRRPGSRAAALLAQGLLVQVAAEVDQLGVVQQGLEGVADRQVEAVRAAAAPHDHHHREVGRQVERLAGGGAVDGQELGAHRIAGDDGLARREVALGDGEGEGDAPGQGGEGAHGQPGRGVREVEHHRDAPQAGGDHRRGAHVAAGGQHGVGAEGGHGPPGLDGRPAAGGRRCPAGAPAGRRRWGRRPAAGAGSRREPAPRRRCGRGRGGRAARAAGGGPQGVGDGQSRVDVAGRAAARNDDAERERGCSWRRVRRPGGIR